MSFWTGFTTGLASSVDKGLQAAMKARDEELSSARNFWMQRQATKLEKAEEENLYGSVQLNMQNGKIVNINKIESVVKPKDITDL